jgi:hypothetical protein
MRIACWVPKSTNTNSEYVILIAFPRQQWLHELACMFRYTYLACLFTNVQASALHTQAASASLPAVVLYTYKTTQNKALQQMFVSVTAFKPSNDNRT